MTLYIRIHEIVHLLIQKEERLAASWLLDKLLEEFSDFALAHHDRAVIAYDDGDMGRAELHFERAAALAVDNFIFQKSHADFVWSAQSLPEIALPLYLKALKIKPHHLETLLIVAQLFVAMGNFEQAMRFLEKVIEIEPDHEDATKIACQIRRYQGDSGASQKTAQDFYKSAQIKLTSGDRQGARQDLENALREDSEFALAHNDLAVLSYDKGDMQAALQHYEAAVGYEPYNIVFIKNLGDFYFKELGDVSKALEKYVQAMRLDARDVEVLLGIGDICLNVKQPEDARFFFQRVLEIDPESAQAVAGIERLRTIGNDQKPMSACNGQEGMDLHAQALEIATKGALDDAIVVLERVVADQPTSAAAQNDLAVLYFESGKSEAALQHYEKAVQIDPDNTVFLKNLADFYYVVQKRTEDALTIYVRLLDRDHEDVDCLVAAGTICEDLAMPADARLFFSRVMALDPANTYAVDALARLPEDPEKTDSGKEGIIFRQSPMEASGLGH